MKNYKFLIIILVTLSMVTSQSCKKGYFEGINEDPNRPTVVTPNVLLGSAEGSLAYYQGGDIERFTSVLVQYITGADRQFAAYQNYIFTEEDFNNLWINLYAGNMEDLKQIMNYAADHAGEYTIYDGMARILMAYSLGLTTDLWGDIPYKEAFQGVDNLQPAYDSQQDIYTSIQDLLTEGIDSLTNDPGDDLLAPGSDDFLFSGDPTGWIAFAHGLKARYYLHLSKVDAGAYQNALDELNAGTALTGNGGNVAFGFSSSAWNPWFDFNNERYGYISYSSIDYNWYLGNYCTDIMQTNNDPRFPVYIDVTGAYYFGSPGFLGGYFNSDNSPVFFFTYAEQKFIEAEAKLMTGDAPGAQTAFTDAIQASMDQFGVDGAAYIAAHGTLAGTEQEMLAQIIFEKYIANYLSPESWNDYRRTGYPALSPISGTAIPRRLIYPTNERLYNPNGVNQGSNLFTPKLWWDQ